MSFTFEIEDKEKYTVPSETKYKYALINLNKNIIYHKKFIEDTKKITTNYVVDEIIGKGGASVVYKGLNTDNNEKIIIKELKTTNINKLIREVNILKLTKDIPNVIRLLDFFKNNENYCLVFPYYNCLPTRTIFYGFTAIEIKIFMYKFLQTLEKLHEKGIIHRDLKPGNLLVKSCNDFVIIDFGISDFYLPYRKFCNKIGTRNFKAPEQLLLMKGFDYKIDIWAAGIIFAEIFFQKYPFWKPEEDNIILENIYYMIGNTKFSNYLKKIGCQSNFDFMKNPSKMQNFESYFERDRNDEIMNNLEDKKNGIDLLKKMLEIDPNNRFSAEECLKHPYFNSIRINE
jgi:casein kinase II subunit alpha